MFCCCHTCPEAIAFSVGLLEAILFSLMLIDSSITHFLPTIYVTFIILISIISLILVVVLVLGLNRKKKIYVQFFIYVWIILYTLQVALIVAGCVEAFDPVAEQHPDDNLVEVQIVSGKKQVGTITLDLTGFSQSASYVVYYGKVTLGCLALTVVHITFIFTLRRALIKAYRQFVPRSSSKYIDKDISNLSTC